MSRNNKIIIATAIILIAPVLSAPMPEFDVPFSTVVEARDGSLLGARIADDGQWRFPAIDQVPEKFEKSLMAYEDRWFHYHPGINPVAIIRALVLNIRKGETVSGGSTITMQVARLAAGNRRTYLNKMIEILSALKLELFRSKAQILRMYASNAPFGGNTVGLGAAAWRYTGKPASSLSWGEAAGLAVLPNSPRLVYPGRNPDILKRKRDALLRTLYERGEIDSLTLVLATDEPVPGAPASLPSLAPHLTDHFFKAAKGKVTVTTIDPELQEKAAEIINGNQDQLTANHIGNSACIIIDVPTGNVLAYVGNSLSLQDLDRGEDVDVIRSERSTGSILKPFLYAAMQSSGDLLPNTLVPDVPTRFDGFSPRNFNPGYSGAVPAGSALSQSLNIPAVRMLQIYTPEKFLQLLRKTGFTTLDKPASHYGLSLILGGGETSLWELTGAYASLSRVLDNYNNHKKYSAGDYHPPVLVIDSETGKKEGNAGNGEKDPPLSASSIWLTYEALRQVNRPETESGWQFFSSSRNIAWKTGTSYGFRDGWAIGTTPRYVIGVWTGNASGEGRPGLTGAGAAAPILFDLLNIMPPTGWFSPPVEELALITVCKESGYRAGQDCPATEEIYADVSGLKSNSCPYHRIIHLDRTGTRQVTLDCEQPENIITRKWFVLPPAMEYYYRLKHPEYKPLPPVQQGCDIATIPVMEFIYPVPGVKLFIPRDQTGSLTRIVAEIAHRNPSKKIFWHMDEKFVAVTSSFHQADFQAGAGHHILTAVDEDGNTIRCGFDIIN